MILRLSNQVFKKMERHVLSTYPEEGCGVLIGSKKGTPIIVDVIPLKNVASELRTRRYRFDPLEFMKASEVAEEDGIRYSGACGPVAQLVERRFCTPEVSGSNPLGST